MKRSIFKGMLLVSVLSLLACTVLIMDVLYGYFDRRANEELHQQATSIARGVEAAGMEYFEGFQASERVTWITAAGTVLYDNQADQSRMENHSDREEFIEAKSDGAGEATRYSSTLAEKTIYYALRLEDGSVLRVSQTQYTVLTVLMGLATPVVIVLLCVMILSAVLSSAVVKRIVKPINAIDPEHPDTDADYEEIAPLLYKIHTQNQEIARQMQTLKKQQEEFRQLTAHMREGLLVADSHCEVLSWNAAALEIFGVPEPSDTRNIYEFNHSEPFRMAVEQALAGQPAEQLLSLGQHSYRMLASPVQEQDAVTGIMVLLLDVTEQEHREQLRREFTSNVSHEMKTPLTAIHAIAGMLVQDVIEPKDVKKFAGDIYRESARMIALVNDTLRLSRMDENGIAEPKEPVDLYDLAEEVIARLRVTAEKKQVAFSLAGTHVTVNGVYSMLEEMIYNLCDNAVKYNKEQGTVTVSVLTAGKEGILMVQDTGIGIPQEDQSRIFERFYRVDKSHSRAIGGTGLGLSIVKHGAAYHNAQVQVSSKPGEGSTFTVIFPETLQA